jgi:hypothetical protein
MSQGDAQVFLIGQFLQLFLPQSVSHSIGAAPVCRDEQRLLVRVKLLTTGLPPSADALHSELSGVMVDMAGPFNRFLVGSQREPELVTHQWLI